jgi:hypothetical protein
VNSIHDVRKEIPNIESLTFTNVRSATHHN